MSAIPKEIVGSLIIESTSYPPLCAYLFDVDGVLTNPWTKKVEREGIFTQLQKRLAMRMIVCLNSGRAANFLQGEILDPLRSRFNDSSLMENVVAIGEKGGVLITHDESDQRIVRIEKDLQVPLPIQEQIKTLLEEKYSATMFYDYAKLTMVTLEALPLEQMGGKTPDDFKRAQTELCRDLQTILDQAGLSSRFRIDPTGIATDVESILTGKAHGADIFIQYLNNRGLYPKQFKCFGDSRSDIEMHKRLIALGLPSKFIFVGEREKLINEQTDGIIFMADDPFDRATLRYLEEENFSQNSE